VTPKDTHNLILKNLGTGNFDDPERTEYDR
jgi:hypothetical protein